MICSNHLSYENNSEPDRSRTYNPRLRRAMLYPIELRVHSLYYGWESNPHEHYCSRDFKSLMSTNSITIASNMLFFLHFWYSTNSKNFLFHYYFVNIRNLFYNSKLNLKYFLVFLRCFHLFEPPIRFELMTPRLQITCSGQLSYGGNL